ncbi:Stk1 family PASTA domain-containing Ser/Thr kinase [Streptomyces hygroscopicus]|uniref:non-specific serine/threonine protein kinase n=1 Tax=Streptomyces demainii TaxID=588122 RepID=A0ABT9KQB8_9ACTN|nr:MULTISPECIES: Stk1 family PASTA domain-containing Ser/Thr kinase [Streptomyces]MCO8305136.1 Stk1 family PASTA domain-containing Ser/Thr kinase [Streptomyces sp. RKCA744]MDP9610634.1 serine/threonine-protein kinase [Streptomyces demainii]
MDTTLQDPLVGQVLDGRYRVEARIAVGGMATVYRAVDTRLDRVLALKVMHQSLASDAAFVDRFIREAKSVARLAHANVVAVYDQGTDGDHVYLAMEYVAGCTLRDVLRRRGALHPRAALDILEPVLAALGAAHRAGFVHRDMKPENVLIGDDGRVKVADFGLVRAVDTNTSASTGAVLGTVSYLAPEQIEHGTADTRADVYACGVVLYEMLTGVKPHGGSTPAQVLYQHLNEDVPPPSAIAPEVAPELDALVASATARTLEERPADAVALLGAARTARAALTDAQLDAVPPQAKEDTSAGSENRTAVIPRPAAAGDDPEPLHHTSRLELPPEPPRPEGRGRGGRGRLPRRGIVTIAAAVLLLIGLGVGVWYVSVGQFTEVPPVLRKTRAEAEKKLHDAGLDVKVVNEFSDVVPKGKVIGSKPGPGERVRGSVTIRVSQGPPRAEVPNVVGMPLADAKRKIADQGLTVGKITRSFSSETAQGSVLSTSPGSGSVRRPETAVSIVVSQGRPVDVPDVVGDSVAEARSTLQEEGFKVKVAERQVFSEEDKGSVAAQSPSADDRAAKGDTVTLTVSKGPQMIEVPDVTGLKVDEAKQQLEEAGFKVNVDKALLFPGNTVKDQSVEAGDEAPKGSTITIKLDGGVF